MRYKETISREEYGRRLARGWKFTPACLYEQQHCPKGTVFIMVEGLGPKRVRKSV